MIKNHDTNPVSSAEPTDAASNTTERLYDPNWPYAEFTPEDWDSIDFQGLTIDLQSLVSAEVYDDFMDTLGSGEYQDGDEILSALKNIFCIEDVQDEGVALLDTFGLGERKQ